jgi:hypothetical protein
MKTAPPAASKAGLQKVGSRMLRNLVRDTQVLQVPEDPVLLDGFLARLRQLRVDGIQVIGCECTHPGIAALLDKNVDGQHIIEGQRPPIGKTATRLAYEECVEEKTKNLPRTKKAYIIEKADLDAMCAAALLIMLDASNDTSFFLRPDVEERVRQVDDLDLFDIPIRHNRPCQQKLTDLSGLAHRLNRISAVINDARRSPRKRVRHMINWLLYGDKCNLPDVEPLQSGRVYARADQVSVIEYPVSGHEQIDCVSVIYAPTATHIGRFLMWKLCNSVVHIQEIQKVVDGPYRIVVRKLLQVDLDMVALARWLTARTGQEWTGSDTQILLPKGKDAVVSVDTVAQSVVQFIAMTLRAKSEAGRPASAADAGPDASGCVQQWWKTMLV